MRIQQHIWKRLVCLHMAHHWTQNCPRQKSILHMRLNMVQVASHWMSWEPGCSHHNKIKGVDQLPPTSHAVRGHILIADYATYMMISVLDERPHVLDPKDYGFTEDGDQLLPNPYVNPNPDGFVQVCNCQKCSTIRCASRKQNIAYCKLCKCQAGQLPDCQNPMNLYKW